MKATSLWTPSVKNGGKLVHGPIHGGDQRGSWTELPILKRLHAFSKFAKQKLSGRRHGIFWVSYASAATGLILNDAENLLRKKPQYKIICSN